MFSASKLNYRLFSVVMSRESNRRTFNNYSYISTRILAIKKVDLQTCHMVRVVLKIVSTWPALQFFAEKVVEAWTMDLLGLRTKKYNMCPTSTKNQACRSVKAFYSVPKRKNISIKWSVTNIRWGEITFKVINMSWTKGLACLQLCKKKVQFITENVI